MRPIDSGASHLHNIQQKMNLAVGRYQKLDMGERIGSIVSVANIFKKKTKLTKTITNYIAQEGTKVTLTEMRFVERIKPKNLGKSVKLEITITTTKGRDVKFTCLVSTRQVKKAASELKKETTIKTLDKYTEDIREEIESKRDELLKKYSDKFNSTTRTRSNPQGMQLTREAKENTWVKISRKELSEKNMDIPYSILVRENGEVIELKHRSAGRGKSVNIGKGGYKTAKKTQQDRVHAPIIKKTIQEVNGEKKIVKLDKTKIERDQNAIIRNANKIEKLNTLSDEEKEKLAIPRITVGAGDYYDTEIIIGTETELMDTDLSKKYASPLKKLQYIKDAAEGLKALHRIGLFHGDIKPANIFVKGDSGKLADLDGVHDMDNPRWGGPYTYPYYEKEQAKKDHLSDDFKRMDIKALQATTLLTLGMIEEGAFRNNGTAEMKYDSPPKLNKLQDILIPAYNASNDPDIDNFIGMLDRAIKSYD